MKQFSRWQISALLAIAAVAGVSYWYAQIFRFSTILTVGKGWGLTAQDLVEMSVPKEGMAAYIRHACGSEATVWTVDFHKARATHTTSELSDAISATHNDDAVDVPGVIDKVINVKGLQLKGVQEAEVTTRIERYSNAAWGWRWLTEVFPKTNETATFKAFPALAEPCPSATAQLPTGPVVLKALSSFLGDVALGGASEPGLLVRIPTLGLNAVSAERFPSWLKLTFPGDGASAQRLFEGLTAHLAQFPGLEHPSQANQLVTYVQGLPYASVEHTYSIVKNYVKISLLTHGDRHEVSLAFEKLPQDDTGKREAAAAQSPFKAASSSALPEN